MKILSSIFLCMTCFITTNVYSNSRGTDEISSIPDVKWKWSPRITLKSAELEGYDREALIEIETNVKGDMVDAKIIRSTGIEKLDQKILDKTMKSSFYPYQENGIFYRIKVEQPFKFFLSREPEFEKKPNIKVNINDIKGKSRFITIYSEADNNGNLTIAKIEKSSGLTELDNYVLNEFRKQAKFLPLIINGKPYPITKSEIFYFSENFNTIK
ncbi:hypothetical protein [Acinetobacter tjernbergiae]|uniref:TonB C-terminal domain-containing protein n=1 Tax=Acinetobacter tjernbergiae DSM 14971 = CIP 107465 TaxID=1120928 RepID=V2W2Y7_9GAMM|nr:hypothetical protein [Acinetobacter tjernbergiae]ESK54349.1 hypothetical protein F990_02807 [Acinetobacter tjernbergiae DSM 14971 = CIP 107465]